MPEERLILLARRPLLGRVKTRLVPPLTPSEALALHRAMLLDSLGLVRRCGSGRLTEVRFDADWQPDPLMLEALSGLPVRSQGPGDLGARMLRAFAESRSAGTAATVVIGADSPTLPAGHVDAAFDLLARGHRAVMAPALDGGYVLLGLRDPIAEIFRGIAWGGPTVAAATRERANRAGVAVELLDSWDDVDDAVSLERLRHALADRRAAVEAPATRRCLEGFAPSGRVLDAPQTRVL